MKAEDFKQVLAIVEKALEGKSLTNTQQVDLASRVIDYLSRCPISTLKASKFTGLDRGTTDRSINELPVMFSSRGGDFRNFRDVIRACILKRKGDPASDRRNTAQARKAEVETAILERKYRPADEFEAVFQQFHSDMDEIFRNERDLPEDLVKRIFERFNLLAAEWMEKGKGDD